jgi:hypothetical protein
MPWPDDAPGWLLAAIEAEGGKPLQWSMYTEWFEVDFNAELEALNGERTRFAVLPLTTETLASCLERSYGSQRICGARRSTTSTRR